MEITFARRVIELLGQEAGQAALDSASQTLQGLTLTEGERLYVCADVVYHSLFPDTQTKGIIVCIVLNGEVINNKQNANIKHLGNFEGKPVYGLKVESNQSVLNTPQTPPDNEGQTPGGDE